MFRKLVTRTIRNTVLFVLGYVGGVVAGHFIREHRSL